MGIASATVEIPTVTWPQVAYVIVVLLLVPIGTQVVLHLQNSRKLNTVKESTAEVVHEVKPNSGSSLADKVNQTAEAVADLTTKFDAHIKEAGPLNEYVRRELEREEYERDIRPRSRGKRNRGY